MKKPSKTTVHEASHAVIAHQLGLKVVEIVVEGNEVGHCDSERSGCPITDACIMLAGHEAEILWFDADPRLFPDVDFKNLKKIKVSTTGCNIVRDPIIAFLKAHKKLIWHVARELDKRKMISRRVFLKLVREVK